MSRRILAVAAVLALLGSSCADDTDTTIDSTEPATTTHPGSTTTPGPLPTAAPQNTTAPTTTPTTSIAPGAGYPAQPVEVPWPTTEWAVGPLPPSVDKEVVAAAAAEALGPETEGTRLRALLVVHGGEIVFEGYHDHPDDTAETLFPSASVAKSFTGTAVGLLVRDGALAVDDAAPVPEWAADERAAITIDDLLRMASGLEYVDGEFTELLTGDYAAAGTIGRPLVAEPGEVFRYSNGTTATLAWIVSEHVGVGDELRQWFETELFAPLGITTGHLELDPIDRFYGAFGVSMTARDYARFGLLFLRGGEWDGTQLLPTAWVDHVRTTGTFDPTDEQIRYGAHFWVSLTRPGVFQAMGAGGQFVFIDVESDLVVVTMSQADRELGGRGWTAAMAIIDEFRRGSDGG